MKVTGRVARLSRGLLGLVLLCTIMSTGSPVAAQSCIVGLDTELLNTMANCSSQPSIDRVFGSQVIFWNGHPHLFTNVGNEIQVWRIDDADNPLLITESDFNIDNVGDSDYDLMNFSVANDGRYGIANYKAATVLFDLGTGSAPSFGDRTANYDAKIVQGGFTFVYQSQQYLIANTLVNECASGDSTLYRMNGVFESTDLDFVGCVEAPAVANTQVLGGFDVDGYLYLGDKTQRVFVFEVQDWGSSIALNYISTPFQAYMVKTKGLAVDLAYNVALEANTNGMSVWDISDPGNPVQRATVAGSFNTAAVAFPFAFVASNNIQHSEKTFDISNPNNPVTLDQDFWSADNPWNYPDEGCVYVMDGAFSPDGTILYLSRYSVLQMADLSACTGGAAPVADVDVSPDPAFPGDTVSVVNQSFGTAQRWAIWVTDSSDPNGTVVAGSPTLSATTPGSRDFLIPIDVAASDDFWAHVAVETDDYPYDPGGSTPDQIATQAITIDRAPTATITLNPEAPITGDSVMLTATAEGHPSHPSGGAIYQWLITDPGGQQSSDLGSFTTVVLDQSGSWTFAVTVHYEHLTGGGSPYVVQVEEQREISSVSAHFVYSPSSPVTTEALVLDASSSNIAAGATPSYDWQITGASTYSGCPDAETCTVPADTLNEGYHDLELTLTNLNNGDSSTETIDDVWVADGALQLDISWSPTNPEIGDTITFTILGVAGDLDSATWNFGGSGCNDFTQQYTCTPGYTDCTTAGYQYATGGSKTVSLSISLSGQTYQTHKIVQVANTGSCPGAGCTYSINPTSASYSSTGGSGSVNVTTQTGCSWNASTSSSWITVTSGATGIGSGTVGYSVAANTVASRTGTIHIAGTTFTITQASGACSYTLSPASADFDAGGGIGTVAVITATGCNWNASSQTGWITITSGASGSGAGTVTYTVGSNPYPTTREGTATIAGNTFTVNQTGFMSTDFTVSNLQPEIGETVVFTVPVGLTPDVWHFGDNNCDGDSPVINCSYLPESYCRTIEWTYREAGEVTVLLKTTTGEKTKVLWVRDQGECPPPCVADSRPEASFTIDPSPAVAGEVVTFTDTSGAPKAAIDYLGFTWDPVAPEIGELVKLNITGTPAVSWVQWEFGEDGCSGYQANVTCTPLYTDCLLQTHKFASGGIKNVSLTAVTTGGSTLGPVTQAVTVQDVGSCDGGGGCTYSINPSTSDYPMEGGAGAIVVSTQDGCAWTATSAVGWVTITSGASGSGSGNVNYTVAANTGPWRSSSVQAANHSHTVNQAAGDGGGGGCTYGITPLDASFPADGGIGGITVATQSGCAWTASSNVAWVTVTAGASGNGNGLVEYEVAANSDAARTGTVRVADLDHQVSQAAGPGNTDPTEWHWQILLDGTEVATSDEQNFTHVFDEPGLYEVRLTAGNCRGEDTAVQSLQVDPAPAAEPEYYLVPAAVHTPGLHGTLWMTDVRLFNPGDEAVFVRIIYLPEDHNNDGGILYGLDFMLAAKETRVFPDIVDAIPGIEGENNKGSLRITFHDDLGGRPTVDPRIVSRTYNDTPEGTFGQFVPAVPVLPNLESKRYHTGLVEDLYYRTNIGLGNMGAEDQWVQLTLLDKFGNQLGNSVGRTVPGYSTKMVNQVAAAAGIQTDLNIFSVEVETFGAEIYSYASVVDNETGDPVLYRHYGLGDEVVFIPGIAHLPGVNDSEWRSDVTFFNPTGLELETRVEYIPSEDIADRPYLEFSPLGPGVVFHYADILTNLLSEDSKGYFIVTGLDGSVVPQIAARTYSQDAVVGTFGQTLQVFGSQDLIGQGEVGYIAGVANSAEPEVGFRTNLGLLNTNQEQWAEVAITIYGEDGAVIGELPGLFLSPGQFQQWNLFQKVGLVTQDIEAASVAIEVLSNGPLAAYASIVDNLTQDPILVPALVGP